MSSNQIIDMSQLPAPQVVEPVDYETTLSEMKADIVADVPEAAAALELESSTLTKFLQRVAYWFMNRAQKENEDAHAVMLAYAQGDDLDNLGAIFDVERLVITPADNTTTPPTAAVMESDEAFRRRIQLAPKGFSVAGPFDAYIFHALSADGRVKDVNVESPTPGAVLVTVLSHEEDGSASAELLQIVDEALSDKTRRPLTDDVTVRSAEIVHYSITADVYMLNGPDTGLVLEQAYTSAQAFSDQNRSIGGVIGRSAIDAAIHVNGVYWVDLSSPAQNLMLEAHQAPYCDGVTLNPMKAGDAA
jgi:phage-related baseplate assembly protein